MKDCVASLLCSSLCVGTWLKPSSVAALSLCAAHGFEVICFCSLSVNTLACYFALLLRTTCVEACVKGLIRVAVACLGCGRHTSCEGRLAAGRRRDTRMNLYGYVRRTLKGLERETRVARCVRTVHARARCVCECLRAKGSRRMRVRTKGSRTRKCDNDSSRSAVCPAVRLHRCGVAASSKNDGGKRACRDSQCIGGLRTSLCTGRLTGCMI